MKQVLLTVALLAMGTLQCAAQEPIYRCGNEYTNTKPDARAKGCKLVEGGNITVVQGGLPNKSAAPKAPPANTSSTPATSTGPKVTLNEQKTRDTDTRMILQSELKKAIARQDDLKKEYNNGEPEKRGEETRNYQKYLDRVAELKANVARTESDIAGIKRELDRLPAAPGGSSNY